MTQFDRRRVLTSLASGAAVAGVSHAISNEAFPAPVSGALLKSTKRREGWLIARQRCESFGQSTVEFWSMPWADIPYANHLPPQIARGMVSYEEFPQSAHLARNAMGVFNGDDENFHGWFDLRQLDRFVADSDGRQTLSHMLIAFLGQASTSRRTALLAMDSVMPGPLQTPWEGILPAFAPCYRSMIGISHFEQRGLCQQRAYLERMGPKGYFDRAFLEPASLCDAVIVTSAGLIETDAGLCPSVSTENLVGELVRRLSYALLEPKILERIVSPSRTKPQRRYFALGSATLNAPSEALLHLQTMLDRQNAFVSASFAPLAADELPLFIATSKDDDLEQSTGAMDVLARSASISGYALSPDMFATVQAPPYQSDTRRPGWLDLIALWPFKVDG